MNMNLPGEIFESVLEVVEPDIQFYRQGPEDEAKHFADGQIAEFVTGIVVDFVIPILLMPVSEFYKQKFLEWRQRRNDSRNPEIGSADEIHLELSRILSAKGAIVITAENRDEAVSIVSDYLSFHGWPKSLAEASSKEIVDTIKNKLSR